MVDESMVVIVVEDIVPDVIVPDAMVVPDVIVPDAIVAIVIIVNAPLLLVCDNFL